MAQSEYGTEQIPIVEAGFILSDLPKRLAEKNRPVAITRHDKPVLAVMTWELFESIAETLEIMADDDMMAALRRGIEDVREGNLVQLEQALIDIDSTESKGFVDST